MVLLALYRTKVVNAINSRIIANPTPIIQRISFRISRISVRNSSTLRSILLSKKFSKSICVILSCLSCGSSANETSLSWLLGVVGVVGGIRLELMTSTMST